jgi:hypothetical protein
MPLWQWAADSVGAVLLLILLYGVCLVLRRRWVARSGDAFELSLRVRSDALREGRGPGPGRGWVLGLGRYSGEALEFFRIFSLALRPMRVLDRAGIVYDGQRDPEPAEVHSLYVDHVVVLCHDPAGPFELAMTASAVTGFLSWLEAAPPGQLPRPL